MNGGRQCLRIGIKQNRGGLFSVWANTELKVGDVLDAMGPHGSFTWRFEPGARRRYPTSAGSLSGGTQGAGGERLCGLASPGG